MAKNHTARGNPNRGAVELSLVVPFPDGLPQRQAHPFHEIVYVLSGGARRVRAGDTNLDCGPGDALCYPAETSHLAGWRQDLKVQLLVLQWTDAAAHWDADGPFRVHDSQGWLLSALTWMRHASPPAGKDDRALLKLLLRAALLEISRLRHELESERDPVREAARILRSTIQHPFSLHELARHVGLNPYYLERRFSSEMGVPPMKYLQRRRLERALSLILGTRQPLKEIAREVGYSSGFYLSALIKREYGRSPSKLRDSRARGRTRRHD